MQIVFLFQPPAPPFVLTCIAGLAQAKPQKDQESINWEGRDPLRLGCAGIAKNVAAPRPNAGNLPTPGFSVTTGITHV